MVQLANRAKTTRAHTCKKETVKLFAVAVGIVLYYLCIVVYLYGDLAIYATAIPKALTSVVW